jgi:hypothetical protein
MLNSETNHLHLEGDIFYQQKIFNMQIERLRSYASHTKSTRCVIRVILHTYVELSRI